MLQYNNHPPCRERSCSSSVTTAGRHPKVFHFSPSASSPQLLTLLLIIPQPLRIPAKRLLVLRVSQIVVSVRYTIPSSPATSSCADAIALGLRLRLVGGLVLLLLLVVIVFVLLRASRVVIVVVARALLLLLLLLL